MVKKGVKWALCVLPLVYLAFFSLRVVLHIDTKDMGDFYKDYFWAKEFRRGVNPYDVQSVLAYSDRPNRPEFPFLYMPPSLCIFIPFTFMEYETARLVTFCVYGLALFVPFALFSRRLIADSNHLPLFCFFAIFAFNGALNKNIHTGNVNAIEAALLFLALGCFLKGKIRWFVSLVLAASVFKLTPLFFLCLAVFERKHWRFNALLCAVFAAIMIVSFRAMPVSLAEWLPFARSAVGGYMDVAIGYINPSMYCLAIAIHKTVTAAGLGHPAVTKPLMASVFLFISVGVLVLTAGGGVCVLHKKSATAKVDLAVLAILSYALLMPRFFDYMWILLIPAVFRVLMANEYARTIGPLMLLCVIPHREDTFPGLTPLFRLIGAYTPVLVAFSAWALHLLAITRGTTVAAVCRSMPLRFFSKTASGERSETCA